MTSFMRVFILFCGTLVSSALAVDETHPLPPLESAKTFRVPDNLKLDLVLSDPEIAQPVFINFDERGRMWVVEYRQYPEPAGLKLISRDAVWRVVYDKTPLPPPLGVRGADRITIHEDTTGKGVYDKHTVFADGLNIATAVERGHGGVWVMNPPYLLFYADKNNDDIPDSSPEVCLQGFGLEDTHSVANSIRWGPDGWLYGAQGSTVTGHIKRPDQDDKAIIHTVGQLIWRYHPVSRRFEVFAEGGGNTFGVELDAEGRIFSGHNGGDTRGFHYVQGGYSQKGFDKHGPLSNPYTFGYFLQMAHDMKAARFTHTFTRYESDTFPEQYRGKIFACQPLSGAIIESELIAEGSTFRTRDVADVVTSSDSWFRPVDIKLGPDGALYIADWYDHQVNHYRNHEGQIDRSNGRVYRLQGRESTPQPAVDLSRKSTQELIALLGSPNRWTRQTVLRLLGDRRDPSAIPSLRDTISTNPGHLALESLWALYQSGGFSDELALQTLQHKNPFVRLWTVRLLCDEFHVSHAIAQNLEQLARREENDEVRNQLACSARRLPAADALPIVRGLLTHSEDNEDKQIPLLLWWAIESKCATDRDAVIGLFNDTDLWEMPLVKSHILERISRRFASDGTQNGFLTCAALFKIAPTVESRKTLLAGIEKAFEGRAIANLPIELLDAMAKAGGDSTLLNLRLRKPDAIEKALSEIADEKLKSSARIPLIQVLADLAEPRAIPVLLNITSSHADLALRKAALAALQSYDDSHIAETILADYKNYPVEMRESVQFFMAGRASWSLQFLKLIESSAIERTSVKRDVVDKLRQQDDPGVAALVEKFWGKPKSAGAGASAEAKAAIERYREVIRKTPGSAVAGKATFKQRCATCHTLFGDGGHVGPELTSYKRDDLDTMLLSVLSPSAEIREGFESFAIKTKDGRRLTGIMAEQDKEMIVIRGADGQDVRIARDDIAIQKPTGTSLMPEGVLEGLSESEVRDLFAYLRSSQPPK